jgi:hypothetical protein
MPAMSRQVGSGALRLLTGQLLLAKILLPQDMTGNFGCSVITTKQQHLARYPSSDIATAATLAGVNP